MSRTVLFHRLRRSLQLAQLSLHTQEPPAELVERRAEEVARRTALTMNRRQFLTASAGGLAVVALNGCAGMLGGSGSGEPVLIVGAGIAGLTAGYRLRQQNVPVRIMEAQNRIGGRMYSLRNFFPDGQVVELGGELIDTPHTHIQDLAKELGIDLDDLSIEDRALAETVWFFGGQRHSDAEVVEAFRPIAARIERDLATLSGDRDPTYDDTQNAERLDGMTIAQWLDGAGVSGWVRDLIRVGYTTEYGLELEEQSALNFLLMIEPGPDEFRIFGESDERYHVHDGNDRIPQTLASRLEDAIELNTRLEAISERAGGGYTCTFRRGSSSFDLSSDHVLITIPFTMLRQVRLNVELPEAKRRAIEELGYGTNAKLMVGFSEKIWREKQGSTGSVLSDLPLQLTWETSRKQPGRHGILTNFTGGRHGVELGTGTPADQAAALTRDLERIFPGISATRAGMKEVRFHWPTHPFTNGSYASYKTGQWTAFRGAEGERVRNLHFAGEHCSLDAQGFMEGGCETGDRAAGEILADLGIRVGVREAQTPRRRVLVPA